MSFTPLEQLLNSYLYSCQPVLPVPYYFYPPISPPKCLPFSQHSSPDMIQTTSPPSYLCPSTYSSEETFSSPPQMYSSPPQTYSPPQIQTQITPPSRTTPPPLYNSPPPLPQDSVDETIEPVPSVVIHHKPGSYPPPPPSTFHWIDQTQYRTKLMDSEISKTELLDLLSHYPLNPPTFGKTRKRSSSSSSPPSADTPYSKHASITNNRTSFTSAQLECLEIRFKKSPTIDRDERLDFSVQIGVSETAIRTWFQNRRAKQRRADLLKKQAQQAAETGTVDLDNLPSV
ncbi:uncharacterized protein LOC134822916 [Bolinopsis microptera]|uniref:uncharacterized protein LOC134822916 n=1 Tax=Bolinopsis microptera TaxID=2820187 RepID=UPI003079A094